MYALAVRLGLTGYVGNNLGGVDVEVEGSRRAVSEFVTALRQEAPPLAVVDEVVVRRLPARGRNSTAAGGSWTGTGAGFQILASDSGGAGRTQVCADSATCDSCLRELADPADRRYRYPFVNCTNCGPRFTIVRDVPYDRPLTTMAGFAMCPACEAEYHDPADRRFHAQPTCCPDCGPTLRFVLPGDSDGDVAGDGDRDGHGRRRPPTGEHALRAAVDVLVGGGVVAVKGLGGYHLAVRAYDESAAATLRARKHREDKPFAVMAADLDAVRELCEVDDTEAALLTSRRRPIVLLRRRPRAEPEEQAVAAAVPSTEPPTAPAPTAPAPTAPAPTAPAPTIPAPIIADSVAPGRAELGVMLPYTPLHHLLLAAVPGPVVLTSGNVSDEPIVHHDDEALARLGGIADAFLTHDRPIHVRADDSVARVVAGRASVVRRARGYAPEPIDVPWEFPRPVLACGAELKNTFCLGTGRRAYLSGHVGDLENYRTLRSFTDGVEHFQRLFDVRPEVVAYDLHPEYLSTKYALDRAEAAGLAAADVVGVQHHHAHVASCLADNDHPGPVIGVAFDGLGFGLDGTLWGGEFLFADLAGFTRLAHFETVPMPGGQVAVRQPWRMAAAYLDAVASHRTATATSAGTATSTSTATGTGPAPGRPDDLAVVRRNADRWDDVVAIARSGARAAGDEGAGVGVAGVAAPGTSSVGRLFDAVAALLDVRDHISYEGQAAIELEQLADSAGRHAGYPVSVHRPPDGGPLRLRGADVVRGVVHDIRHSVPAPVVAARFHSTLARVVVSTCVRLRDDISDRAGLTAEEAEAQATAGRIGANTVAAGTVALSGGVFGNLRLLRETVDGLTAVGFTVLTHSRVPCNDGGLSLGQAVVAGATVAARPTHAVLTAPASPSSTASSAKLSGSRSSSRWPWSRP